MWRFACGAVWDFPLQSCSEFLCMLCLFVCVYDAPTGKTSRALTANPEAASCVAASCKLPLVPGSLSITPGHVTLSHFPNNPCVAQLLLGDHMLFPSRSLAFPILSLPVSCLTSPASLRRSSTSFFSVFAGEMSLITINTTAPSSSGYLFSVSLFLLTQPIPQVSN